MVEKIESSTGEMFPSMTSGQVTTSKNEHAAYEGSENREIVRLRNCGCFQCTRSANKREALLKSNKAQNKVVKT